SLPAVAAARPPRHHRQRRRTGGGLGARDPVPVRAAGQRAARGGGGRRGRDGGAGGGRAVQRGGGAARRRGGSCPAGQADEGLRRRARGRAHRPGPARDARVSSAYFENAGRLLRPGGLLVFTVPVYDGPLGWLVDRLDHDETHVHRRGRDFWLEQVPPSFTVRHYTGVWRYFFFGRFYLNLMSRVCRRWTTAILVVAEKGPR